jgi:uncharacterized protein (TIGR02145 family)
MDAGDLLHILIIDENGDTASVDLVDSDIPQAPGKPTTKVATSITDSGFTANWYLNQNSTSYRLDVSDDPEFGTFVLQDHDAGDAITHAIAGLSSLKTYYFRVRAVNPFGTSISSDAREVTTSLTAVTDADGNSYTYVTIGTQQWMVENLKTTKYADGEPIPNFNGFDDWYLPSKDEFQAIHDNLIAMGIGNFQTYLPARYGTSSEGNATTWWALWNNAGVWAWGAFFKNVNCLIRPIRSFIGGVGAYVVGDTGPAGGWIFYVDGGTTYYEAAPADIADVVFSNIDTLLIGTTGTAIGTGQANSTAIIGQLGHTASAAKDCLDFIGNDFWALATTGAYCYYNNDIANKTPYGALYNWYAVNNAHGLAPTGWRVPDDTDWNTLIAYAGGSLVAGGKLKEQGITHWTTPNTGATDEYGFNSLPGGYRGFAGAFGAILLSNHLWSSTDVANPPYKRTQSSTIVLTQGNDSKGVGMTVRCMRDI